MAGALTLIATQSPSAGANIQFAAIPQTYHDLIVVLFGRGAGAISASTCALTVNGDTAGNYVTEDVGGTGATVSAAGNSGNTSLSMGSLPGGSATANYAGYCEAFIPGYASTSFFHPMYGRAAVTSASATQVAEFHSALWKNTAAITQIDVQFFGGFAAGTVARLYGRT